MVLRWPVEPKVLMAVTPKAKPEEDKAEGAELFWLRARRGTTKTAEALTRSGEATTGRYSGGEAEGG